MRTTVYTGLCCLFLTACSSVAVIFPPEGTDDGIPSRILLPVPFSPQAPAGDWGAPYQEACEEAALIMTDRFFKDGETAIIPAEEMDAAILDLVQWETAHGYGEDVTITELAAIARDYYDYEAEIIDDVTTERLRELVAGGHPVIVPAAGRALRNPYFSGEGPFYHMLVIRGFDRRNFITNDPGTRRGAKYKYAFDVLLGTIHDWTGVKEEIERGEKRALVLTLP